MLSGHDRRHRWQGGRARLHTRVPRTSSGRPGRARAGGRSGDREIDMWAQVSRPLVNGGSVFSFEAGRSGEGAYPRRARRPVRERPRDVLPAFSTPRRHALEVALLVEDEPDGLDPRTLGVAVRSALEALGAEAPVLLAIDDVQWLDPSSTSALAFALRRMDERPVLLLLARRLGERGARRRSSSGRSMPTEWNGCTSAHSASARFTSFSRHTSL